MLESLVNKVAALKACNFIKKRLQYRCFSVNIGKSFFKNLRWLLMLSMFNFNSQCCFDARLFYRSVKAETFREDISWNLQTMINKFSKFLKFSAKLGCNNISKFIIIFLLNMIRWNKLLPSPAGLDKIRRFTKNKLEKGGEKRFTIKCGHFFSVIFLTTFLKMVALYTFLLRKSEMQKDTCCHWSVFYKNPGA